MSKQSPRVATLRVSVLCFLYLATNVAQAAALPNQADDSKLKEHLAALSHSDMNVRLKAVMALAELGPKAEPAVPGLIAAMQVNNEDLRLNAAIALGKIGKAAVTPLTKILQTKDADARY